MSKLSDDELERMLAEREAKKAAPAPVATPKVEEKPDKQDGEYIAFSIREDENGKNELVMLKYNNKGECVLLDSTAYPSKSIALARAGEALARQQAKLSLKSIFKGAK